MKKTALMLALFGFGLGTSVQAADPDMDALTEQARGGTKALLEQLGGELKKALESGGPMNALTICNEKAMPMTDAVSEQTGMKVARTSLKPRNAKNAPDAWEEAVLKKFDERKAAGENPTGMEFTEVVEVDGKKTFRYMKAIPTQTIPCLACHGENIKPELAAKIDELYPEDKARGYDTGDIRGAFTISKTLD